MLLSFTSGQFRCPKVKVRWTDLFSLTLILHFFSQPAVLFRHFCSNKEVIKGSSCKIMTVVSSANVPIVVAPSEGRSAVNRR